MGLLARLGNWYASDLAEAADRGPDAWVTGVQLGGGGDVAQVRNLPVSIAQAFGLSIGDSISREDAMRVPTVRRARQVVCGTIGAQPLVAHRRNPDGSIEDVTAQRPLLRQPNPNTTLQFELTWTVDDLWFHGVSWWRVLARDFDRFPIAAERVAPERITVDLHARQVYIDGQPVDNADLIRFDGPDEGLLRYGGPTFQTSRALDAAVRRHASDDIPLAVLRLAEGAEELSNEPDSAGDGTGRSEVEALLDGWEEARRLRSTAYLNRAVEADFPQADARSSQLAEQRAEQRIDEANACNVPPRAVNAPSSDSMTYSTVAAERADLIDTACLGFIVAIEQRLSMGDVTPRGTVVRVDLSRFLAGDTLTALEAAGKAVELEAMTGDEVRADVLGRVPLTPEQRADLAARKPAPAPAPTPQETP